MALCSTFVVAMTSPANIPKPVPNRPLGALDIADGALSILQARPRTVAGIAAAFVLPAQLIGSWLNRGLLGALSFDNFDSETGQFDGQEETFGLGGFGGSPVATVLSYLVLPFLGVALTHLVHGWRSGVDRSTKDCLLFTMRRTHLILAAFLFGKLLQAVTLLLATPWLILVAPIIAVEGLGPVAAIKRAFELGRRRYGQLFVLCLLIVLIHVLLTYALLALPVVGAFLLNDWGWVAFFALNSIGSTVLNVLGVGAAVFAYFDVRDRTEGADIAERIAAARG